MNDKCVVLNAKKMNFDGKLDFSVSRNLLNWFARQVDESFSDFRDKSVQDFRFALSEGIRQQVYFATLVQNIETQIKSSSIINALKQAIVKQEHYL